MDPITAAALATVVVPLVSGTAGEAGRQAWSSLVTFVQTRFGHDSTPARAAGELQRQPADPEPAQTLADALEQAAGQDHDVNTWLRSWLDTTAPLVRNDSRVVNVVGGNATVHGPVIQTHSTGSITFNAPPSPSPSPSPSSPAPPQSPST